MAEIFPSLLITWKANQYGTSEIQQSDDLVAPLISKRNMPSRCLPLRIYNHEVLLSPMPIPHGSLLLPLLPLIFLIISEC